LPEIGASMEFFIDSFKIVKKQAKLFDSIKAAIENIIGHEIEYAECDVLFNLISSTVAQNIDFEKIERPEDVARMMIIETAKLFPKIDLTLISDSVAELTQNAIKHVNEIIDSKEERS